MSLVEAFRTAAEMYEPDDTVGLLGLLIIALPATLAAIGTSEWSVIPGAVLASST